MTEPPHIRQLIFLHGWHHWRDDPILREDCKRDLLLHCMPGWRILACWLDNITPHRELDDHSLIGRRGFGWICRLHDRLGN